MISFVCDILDYILPSSDRSKHDTLRLEYISACQVMENETDVRKILRHIPAFMYEPLLQSVIYKSYLEFINVNDISIKKLSAHLREKELVFPETLSILILNWPHTELVLKSKIPPLHPHMELFQNNDGVLPKQSICQVDVMLTVFNIFCYRLVVFIKQAIFTCSTRNTSGYSCNLRKLDLSGLGFGPHLGTSGLACLGDILVGIRNSTVDTFGHKIEILADASIGLSTNIGQTQGFNLFSNIMEENLNPIFGISVYFKRITVKLDGRALPPLPRDFYNILAPSRCEYITIYGFNGYDIDKGYVENIFTVLPELVWFHISSLAGQSNKSLELLSLDHLEHVTFSCNTHTGLINSICNMSKGLKCLQLHKCSLQNRDIECLANSKHADTLIQLDLSYNNVTNDSKAVGLIMLCQKMKNVKVLKIDHCSLHTMSPESVSQLASAFQDCIKLDVLSMRNHRLSLELTNLLIDGLAQKKSLRYLSLDLRAVRNGRLNEEVNDLIKTFHFLV